jgi:Bacterial Ig-like domain (group 3)
MTLTTFSRRVRRRRVRKGRRNYRPQCDLLENRTLLSTFLVTTTADNGDDTNPVSGSFRQAILENNADTANTAADTIDFNIPGSGVQVIQPLSQLPTITHPVVIDGYSQPGSSPNSLAVGDNAVLVIELEGSSAGGVPTGLRVLSSGVTVQGLDINNFGFSGIWLDVPGGDTVQGCFVGTDPTGETALIDGIFVTGNSNVIGTNGDGTNDYAERNVVSGTGPAGTTGNSTAGNIVLEGISNVVAGNYIGSDATGTKSLTGQAVGVYGVDVDDGSFNRIGVDASDPDPAAETNLISGNDIGVDLEGGQNVVAGNLIGTDVTGTHPLGQGVGVFIFAGVDNTIGGTAAGDGNLISGNYRGVQINGGSTDTGNLVQGNTIGTDASGNTGIGNSYGIELSGVGNIIGGTAPGADNTISDNFGYGVWITSSGSGDLSGTANLVEGNRIEFNGFSGVEIDSGSQSNTIGGTAAGAGNIIDNNNVSRTPGAGEVVILGATTVGNAIRGNSIYSSFLNSVGLGIDLGGNGETIPNSPGGPHIGPNDLQNYPALTSASPDSTEVQGTLNSTPNTSFALDFYTTGYVSGQLGESYYLGSATVTTDGSGNAAFDAIGLAATTPGATITATATDPSGNTSEYSLSVEARAATSTTLTSSSSVWVYGQTEVTVDVTAVNPADNSPLAPLQGNVQFVVDGVNFGTPQYVIVGSPSNENLAIPVGTHTVTALFSPTNACDPSTSTTLTVTVTPAPLTITANSLSKTYGTPITFAGTEFTLSGWSYTDPVSSVTLTSAGAAATATVAGSPYPIIPSNVVGSGLSNYNITYVDGSLTVVGDPTSTTMTASSVAPVSGQQITFTATVSSSGPASGPPTGTVGFYDGYSELGTATLSTAGSLTTAALTTTSLTVGLHSVTAAYSGDADFAGSSSQVISTVAGVASSPGYSDDGGPATAAGLNLAVGSPFAVSGGGGAGVAVDSAGDVFIADTGNNVIREVKPDGIITTFAGDGTPGYGGDNGAATSAELNSPEAVAVDSQGDVFIADSGNSVIREVFPDGIITTVVGDGVYGYSGDHGPATSSSLSFPMAIALDSHGDLFVADTGNSVIREVTPGSDGLLSDGTITTVAGNGVYGYSGDGGPATSAELEYPGGVAVDASGDIFISDTARSVIREVQPNGVISTVAVLASGPIGRYEPCGITVDAQGDLFITATDACKILEMPPGGPISVVAGNNPDGLYSGDGGPATSANLSFPGDVAVDNSGDLFIADSLNNVIRRVGGLSLNVSALTVSNLQASLSGSSQNGSGGAVTLRTTSSSAVNTAVQAIDGLTNPNPATTETVTLDLTGAITTPATPINVPSGVLLDLTSSSGSGGVQGATINGGTVVIASSVAPVNWTVNGGNVTVEGSASAGDFIVNGGTVTLANGTVITGNSPAVTLSGGTVILQGATARTATNAPTILVNGGTLIVRNSTIEESTGYAEAAILITGGSVDLGTTASPGGNILNVNGTGTLIENITTTPVPAVGDSFENNGAVVPSNFGAVSLSAPAAQTANQGVAQPFNLGSLTDTFNDSQSWAIDINWGDGTTHTDFNAQSTGSLSPQSHAFALPRTYTVTVTATDPVTAGVSAWDLVQSFTVTVAPSVFVLDPSAGGALSLLGNAALEVPGAIVVDSSSSSALSASGNAQLKASIVDVHGKAQKSGNASFSPAPVTGAATVADPLANLPVPVASTLGLASKGSVSVSGNSSQTIGPGVYSQITASGNASLTLQPGVYIITGGGFTVSGNANAAVSGTSNSITGTGVMIFNAGTGYNSATGADGGTYGAITLSGNGTIKLTAPTTGTYAGILIFQDRANSKALTFSGNAMQGITGTIYAPAAQLDESGNATIGSTTNPISLVVDTLSLSGNAIANALSAPPAGAVAYSPNQVRDAYGINTLSLDGTGQTIAIVDAYDAPAIFQAVDAFDSQFSLTDSGPTLYAQYGPASSFLTVLNQYGQATSLPSTDPNGPGTDNWEVEEALDVEWAHAIAPGVQIVLVEANSQSLSDLMASVGTAAAQPGVSVVSMSWGFPEGQAVFASDEATYDSVFNVPGVTFVASTGDYGAADPEYPAFSPNVVAVGGTSLTLNADNSYNSETGWGYYSASAGAYIASGGGISLYEPEPAYQQGVQSTGSRTTPDVSLVADPATGAWVADPYNLDPSNPFEVVGGTSLSAPAWAGLLALVNQGRAAAGESTLNSATPTDTQQALYMLPQTDYNVIASGTNGYSAGAGYNLVTGLGTPVANLLVPDLIAYQGSGTTYSGPTVGALQNATLTNTGTSSSSLLDVFSAFDSFTVTSAGLGNAADRGPGNGLNSPSDKTQVAAVMNRTATTQNLGIPSAPEVVDPQKAAGDHHVTSPAIIPVAPGSGSGSGMMPLDSLAARDAVLTDWSASPSAARKQAPVRGATLRGPSIRVGTLPGPAVARRPILDVASVEVLFGDTQAAGSLLNDDGSLNLAKKYQA